MAILMQIQTLKTKKMLYAFSTGAKVLLLHSKNIFVTIF